PLRKSRLRGDARLRLPPDLRSAAPRAPPDAGRDGARSRAGIGPARRPAAPPGVTRRARRQLSDVAERAPPPRLEPCHLAGRGFGERRCASPCMVRLRGARRLEGTATSCSRVSEPSVPTSRRLWVLRLSTVAVALLLAMLVAEGALWTQAVLRNQVATGPT